MHEKKVEVLKVRLLVQRHYPLRFPNLFISITVLGFRARRRSLSSLASLVILFGIIKFTAIQRSAEKGRDGEQNSPQKFCRRRHFLLFRKYGDWAHVRLLTLRFIPWIYFLFDFIFFLSTESRNSQRRIVMSIREKQSYCNHQLFSNSR